MTRQNALNTIMRAWHKYVNGDISFESMLEIKSSTLSNLSPVVKSQVIANLQSLGMLSR
jgi:hypothetical protein